MPPSPERLMSRTTAMDQLVTLALAVGLALGPHVERGWALNSVFAVAIGCVLLGAARCPEDVSLRAKVLGPSLAALFAAWTLCLLRAAGSDEPMSTLALHAAVASPLFLVPVFGAALGHGARVRERVQTLILWLAIGYALWILFQTCATDLNRRALALGEPLAYLVVATALGIRLAETPEANRTRSVLGVSATLLCGLAIIALRSRALIVIWGCLVVLGIARSFSHGSRRRTGYLLGALLLGAVTAFGVSSGYGEQLIARFGLMAAPFENLPRLREAHALWELATSDWSHFFLGQGFGAEYSFARRGYAVHQWTGSYTHSLPTYYLLTGGVFSMAAAGWFLLRLVQLAWRARRTLPAVAGLRGMADALLVCVLFLLTYSANACTLVLAAVLGGIVCGALTTREQRGAHRPLEDQDS